MINTGEDVAGIVARLYFELGKKSLEVSSKILSTILLTILKQFDKQLNTGKVNMKRMLESGDEIKQIKISTKDSKLFIKKAKKYGITFSLLDKNHNDDKFTIVFKQKEQEVVHNILEQMKEQKLKDIDIEEDKSLVDEFLVGGSKDIFIVDKENPQNYIATDIKQFDIQKGMIVNKDNADEYISFNENIKERKLSIDIHKPNKETEKYDTNEFSYQDVKDKISDGIRDWENVALLATEDERQKLINKLDKDKNNDKKTMEQVKKEIKKVRDSKQPEKDGKKRLKKKSKTKER